MTEKELEAYHQEFNSLKESFHDVQLENLLNSKDSLEFLSIDINDYFGYFHELDFDLEWKENEYNDCRYSHRVSLKYLFKNGFTWAIVNETSPLYKYLTNTNKYGRHRVLRSPEPNICTFNQRKLAVFCEGVNLFCYKGCGFYYDKQCWDSFNFLGSIN